MENQQIKTNLREAYDHKARERDSSNVQDWKLRERDRFLQVLQQECKSTLLEIGAGHGRDSKFFQEQGLDTTCIDLSPEMVKLCLQKGLKAHLMDTTNLRFPSQSFDSVYALNCLLHLARAGFPWF